MLDALLYIGRFQPFHNGHLKVVESAWPLCRTLVIGLGSANQPLSEKNPFTPDERAEMIMDSIALPEENGIDIIDLYDQPGDDASWAAAICEQMSGRAKTWGILGYEKDASSFYLKLFPGHELHIYNGDVLKINATDVRKQLFEGGTKAVAPYVPRGTYEVLDRLNINERLSLIRQGAKHDASQPDSNHR
jgi:bifunctional NMN adenylyltransferase/nudix hydrolase